MGDIYTTNIIILGVMFGFFSETVRHNTYADNNLADNYVNYADYGEY